MSVDHQDVDATCADECSSSVTTPSLTDLFSRSGSAAGQAATPWHLKGARPSHEKRIGMSPNGTRRSMGKR
jgi:hypothetical protein